MNFDPESAKDQQIEPLGAAFSNARFPILHHHCPFNSGVAVTGIFMPFPSHAMYPNAAVEGLVPGEVRTSFPSGVREDWTGHGSLGEASSQIQYQPLSVNPETDFDSAPQFEPCDPFATPRQQDWPYGTATHYASPNELNLPQAGTVAYAPSATHLYYPTTERQEWFSEHTGPENMPTGVDFAWQDNTAQNPFMNGFGEATSTNLLLSNGSSENTHVLGNGSYDTLNPISPNTVTSLTNDSFEASAATYGISSPYQENSTRATIPSSPQQSTSTASPPPSSPNAPSPNSTRHACLHCPSTFARQGDLRRHEKIHFPERHRKYHCREQGCNRNGRKGFTRRDKWRDHVKNVHGLEEDEIGF